MGRIKQPRGENKEDCDNGIAGEKETQYEAVKRSCCLYSLRVASAQSSRGVLRTSQSKGLNRKTFSIINLTHWSRVATRVINFHTFLGYGLMSPEQVPAP